MTPIVVIGAGGHAKVVIELLRADGAFEVVGCTDPKARAPVLGVPVLGGDEALDDLRREGVRHAFVAIGDNAARLKIGRALVQRGFELPNAISPHACVSPSARFGRGVAVMARASINAEAEIGDFAVVNTGASVDHDCVLSDGVHVAPGVALAGGVRLGEAAFIGVGAAVLPGVRIGAATILGGGGVAVRDLPDGVTAVGVPAVAIR